MYTNMKRITSEGNGKGGKHQDNTQACFGNNFQNIFFLNSSRSRELKSLLENGKK